MADQWAVYCPRQTGARFCRSARCGTGQNADPKRRVIFDFVNGSPDPPRDLAIIAQAILL